MTEHFSSSQATPSLGNLEKEKKTRVTPKVSAKPGRHDSKRRNPNA